MLKKPIIAFFLALGLAAAGPVLAAPGCVGKMWNPITDLDFNLLGPIKVGGKDLMKGPRHLGSPPKHRIDSTCFCKDGLQTGFGLGMTYWLPAYLVDVARQAGCIGFLNGTSLLPGFLPLSSAQEYSTHKRTDNTTNVHIHKARADVVALAGKSVFEKCGETPKEFSIDYLTEPDFIFQNDLYSAILSPQNALIASIAPVAAVMCGVESMANTLGDWRDAGICGWKGTRFPLTGNTIHHDSAQVTNMDTMLKFMTRSTMLGLQVRTMGNDAVCRPKGGSGLYDPFQHRYQWSYPAKVSTRYNVDIVRWGLFRRDSGQGGYDAMRAANNVPVETADATKPNAAIGGDIQGVAQRILSQLPKPLNYPTREVGYLQIWEARQCCLKLITIETVAKFFAGDFLTGGLKDAYEAFSTVASVYEVVQTVDGLMDLAAMGAAAGLAASAGAADAGKELPPPKNTNQAKDLTKD